MSVATRNVLCLAGTDPNSSDFAASRRPSPILCPLCVAVLAYRDDEAEAAPGVDLIKARGSSRRGLAA